MPVKGGRHELEEIGEGVNVKSNGEGGRTFAANPYYWSG